MKSCRKSFVVSLVVSVLMAGQFMPYETVWQLIKVRNAIAETVSSLTGITGQIGEEDINFGTGQDTDTFSIIGYDGTSVTLTKLPSFYANVASIFKGRWYVSAVTGDQGNINIDGSLAWVLNVVGSEERTIELTGDQTYTVDTDMTIPTTVTIRHQRGAIFDVQLGDTLTVNSLPEAGDYQIYSGAGTITGTFGNGELLCNWWANLASAVTSISSSEETLKITEEEIVESGTTVTTPSTLALKLTRSGSVDGVSGGGTETLTVNGQILAGEWQIFGINLSFGGLPSDCSVEWFYDLATAVTAIGPNKTTVVINNEITLTSNVTVPANITLQKNKAGNFTGLYTLTINGGMTGDMLSQWFDSNVTVAGTPNIIFIFPEMFGATGDGVTDDYTAVNKAIVWGISSKKTVRLTKIYAHSTAFTLNYSNTVIEGNLYSNSVGFKPIDCAAFIIDGTLASSGSFAFNIKLRNFIIDNSNVTVPLAYSVLYNDCYRTAFENVRFTNSTMDSANGFTTLLKISGAQLENTYDNPFAVGLGNTGSGSAIHVANTSGIVVLNKPDAENSNIGIEIAANAVVDIYSPYIERNGNGIKINSGSSPSQTPSVNIYGGTIDLGSATSNGLVINGTFSDREIINVDGLKFTSNDHATKKSAIVVSGMTWNNVNKINFSNIDWSWINQPADLDQSAAITPYNPYEISTFNTNTYNFSKASVSDNVATQVFKLSNFTGASPYDPVYVKVKAFTEHNGYGGAIEESVFCIRRHVTGGVKVTTKQILAEVREDGGVVNYSITTFLMSAAVSGTDVNFSITSDFNDVLLTTIDPYFSVEVLGKADFDIL